MKDAKLRGEVIQEESKRESAALKRSMKPDHSHKRGTGSKAEYARQLQSALARIEALEAENARLREALNGLLKMDEAMLIHNGGVLPADRAATRGKAHAALGEKRDG